MVCLSSLNTRVISHCENLQIDDDDVHFNLATDFCVFTFACISTHTKKITEQVIAHTEILLRTKCAKCPKNNYFTYLYDFNGFYGNIKATADWLVLLF